MVETAYLRKNVEISLLVLEGEVSELPRRARENDEGSWRDSEWMTNMSRFEWLRELEAAGRLEPKEQDRYEQLLRLLHQYLPLAEQLDLPLPDKVLEAMRTQPPTKREVA